MPVRIRGQAEVASEPSELIAFANMEVLRERLHEVFGNHQDASIAVGVTVGGEQAFASTSSAHGEQPLQRRIHLGCLTKLLTVGLFERLIESRSLDRESSIGSQLDLPREWQDVARLTPRHLTDHTHGLDDSWTNLALDGSSSMDPVTMFDGASTNPVSRPGEHYSYSHAGAWIMSAILEHALRRKFSELLRECSQTLELLPAFSVGQRTNRICPATGCDLTISLRGLMCFLLGVLGSDASWPSSANAVSITHFPGWSPFESGIFRGWKVTEDGWYGHSSQISTGDTAMVRICPKQSAAIVVMSRQYNANVVALRLFGKSFPGYANMNPPIAAVPNAMDRALLGDGFCGTYRNGRTTFEIRSHEGGSLRLLVAEKAVRLTVASQGFLLAASNDAGIGFIQGITPIQNRFRYVWDGRRLFLNAKDSTSQRG